MKKIWEYTSRQIYEHCIDMYLGTDLDPTWKIIKPSEELIDKDYIKVINSNGGEGSWPLDEASLCKSLEAHRKLIEEKLDSIYNKPLEPFILKSRFSLLEDGNET